MKSTILILGLMFALVSTATMAQTFTALQTESGRFLINDNSVTPPVDEVTIGTLLSASAIKIMDDKKNLPYVDGQVQSFEMTVIKKSGNASVKGKGETITSEMKDLISTLVSGDKVYFEYIVGAFSNGTNIKFKALTFKIQ